jgi:hypothetical protein
MVDYRIKVLWLTLTLGVLLVHGRKRKKAMVAAAQRSAGLGRS